MSLFRDEYPTLDATRTKVDDLAQLSSNKYTTVPAVHGNIGVLALGFPGFGASSTTTSLITLPYPMQLVGVVIRYETASSSGTLQIEKTPSGTAAGSGTNLLTGTVDLSQTAAANYFGTLANLAGGGSGFAGAIIPAGNSISAVLGGTLTGLANATITLFLVRAPI